jgi:hypothetical protein
MSGARVFERLAETFGKRLRNDCPYLLEEPLTISCLNVDQAIGNPVPFTDFALQRGEERLVEAAFRGAKGQAFTSSPSSWQGTVADLLDLPPENDRNRAFFTAGVNAVGRHLGWGEKTVHCRDASPKRSGETMGKHLAGELGAGERVALVGYQPAILGGLAAALGSGRVCVLDLNPENIGRTVSGVTVLDGEKDLPAAASRSDLALATGSALTNGPIDSILEAFGGKRGIFFGPTIAGPAALLGFERLCFESE